MAERKYTILKDTSPLKRQAEAARRKQPPVRRPPPPSYRPALLMAILALAIVAGLFTLRLVPGPVHAEQPVVTGSVEPAAQPLALRGAL